jgi:hypothetical protein
MSSGLKTSHVSVPTVGRSNRAAICRPQRGDDDKERESAVPSVGDEKEPESAVPSVGTTKRSPNLPSPPRGRRTGARISLPHRGDANL